MASASAAGPSRLPVPAPSTSGDSDSTVPQPSEKGVEVGLLKELARSALVESLNDVCFLSSTSAEQDFQLRSNRSKGRKR